MEQSFSRTTKLVVFALAAAVFLLTAFYTIGRWQIKQDRQNEAVAALTGYTYRALGDTGESNLTAKLVNVLAQETINSSQSGIPINNQEKIKEITNQTLSDFHPESLIPKITDSQIKITSDSDSVAIDQYLQQFENIFKDGSFNGVDLDNRSEATAVIVHNYKRFISDLQSLPVPTPLTNFHKRELALLLAKLAVYQKIQNYESDPLGALVAIQSNDFLNTQFVNLKNDLNNFLALNYE